MKYQKQTRLIILASAVIVVALITSSCHPKAEYKIVTVAGNGSSGYSGDGGPARLAALNAPNWVYFCRDYSIVISDTLNRRIRRISPEGIITTIAGGDAENGQADTGNNRLALNAKLFRPIGICEDSSGNIYFADASANRIHRIDSSGMITTAVGGGRSLGLGDGGLARNARIACPVSVLVDIHDSLYFADFDTGRARKVDTGSIITTVAGGGRDITITDGSLATSICFVGGITCVSPGPSGDLYLTVGSAILKVDLSGKIYRISGNPLEGRYHGDPRAVESSDFNTPHGICIDTEQNLYVSDTNNHCIKRITAAGVLATIAGTGKEGYSGDGGSATAAMLSRPWGICVDKKGNIYFADTGNNRIRKLYKWN